MKGSSYKSQGTEKSTYYEGDATVQNKVLPDDATYNTTLNGPNPGSGSEKRSVGERRLRGSRRRRFPKI